MVGVAWVSLEDLLSFFLGREVRAVHIPSPTGARRPRRGRQLLRTTIGATSAPYPVASVGLLAELPFGEAPQSPTGLPRPSLGFEETVSVLDVGREGGDLRVALL